MKKGARPGTLESKSAGGEGEVVKSWRDRRLWSPARARNCAL